MRILFVNTWFYPNMSGGAQNSVKLLADGLVREGHDVAVFSIDKFSDNEVTEIDGIRLFKVTSGKYNLQYMYGKNKSFLGVLNNKKWELFNNTVEVKFLEVLDIYKPDVIHFNSISGMPLTLMKIAKQYGAKTVLTLRDYFLLEFISDKSLLSKVVNKVFRYFSIKFVKYIDIVTSPSEFTLKKFKYQNYFNDIESVIIPNAVSVDLEIIKQTLEEKSETCKKKITFLYVGSIIEKKGIFYLIDSFNLLFKDNIDISLHIVGEGSEVSKLLEIIKECSNIIYHGSLARNDLDILYRSADFLVVPSMWGEPFGRVIIEAAANALPVIVSDQGGMPEIVEELKCGEIFSFDNDPRLDTLLLEMLNKKNYEKYLENIKANIHKYSLEKQVSNFLEIYNNIVDMPESMK